ncbi:hypothetical protein CJJ07_003230 [Candidozyma auris]|nr:hypothetical protein CJJ07_003230 [[Candida] auris]
MKSAEDKVQYRAHFFKLGQGRIVDQDDVKFWNVLIDSPSEASHFFDLLTANDIHTIRDQNLPNFLILVRMLSAEIVKLKFQATAKRQRLVNCVRLLTRLLPFLFELSNYTTDIEPELFWSKELRLDKLCSNSLTSSLLLRRKSTPANLEQGPLAVDLIHALVCLLFVPGFTVDGTTQEKSNSLIWEPGIGISGTFRPPNCRLDCNRVDILKLLLTLTCSTYYISAKNATTEGSRFLSTLVSTLQKQDLVLFSCSLVNLVCRSARLSNSENGMSFANSTLTELRHICVNNAFQLLVSIIAYPLPSTHIAFLKDHYFGPDKRPSNSIRLLFGKLSKESEILFLASNFLNFLRYPLFSLKDEAKRRYYKFGQPSVWALESTVILWELFQCNRTFADQIGARSIPKLVPYVVYHIFAFYDQPQHFNLVKIMAHFLLYISSKEDRVRMLVKSEPSIEAFPQELKMNGVGSIRDFSVINICQVLINLSSRSNSRESQLHFFLRPTLFEILYNLIPTVCASVEATDISSRGMSNVNPKGGLSYKASSAVTSVLLKYSEEAFLLDDSSNPSMLALLVRALCSSAMKNPAASRMTLFTFLKNEKAYDHIWNVIYGLKNRAVDARALEDLDEEEEDNSIATSTPSMQNQVPFSSPGHNRHSFQATGPRSPYTISSNNTSVDDGFTESHNTSRVSLPEIDPLTALVEEEKLLAAALRPDPPTGMSQKFKDKLPLAAPMSRSWGGNDALRIIITIIIPGLKSALQEVWAKRDECNFDSFFIVKQIEHLNFEEVIYKNRRDISHDFLPDTPIHKLAFSWNHMSLGWYLSIIQNNGFRSTDNIKLFIGTNSTLMKNISSSIASIGKIATSWSGSLWSNNQDNSAEQELIQFVDSNSNSTNPFASTAIKLFRVDDEEDKSFNPFGIKFNSHSNGGVADLTQSLSRKLGDFRNGSRGSIVSITSVSQEDTDRPKLHPRNSVSSLHSLNTLNRTRSNTPRNSISM